MIESLASWWEFVADRPEEVWRNTYDHAALVVRVMLVAGVISIGLGIAAHRYQFLRSPLLNVTSIFLTIPSLALFAIFIPFVGIGFAPSFLALLLYSLLPILRNTITGLDEVDSAVIESAKGMGLNARRRLTRIELPLALPVIITGLRVSTLLTTGIAAIAVLVGGPGLGRYIQDGLNRYPLPTSVERMWTGIVFTIVLALAFDLVWTLVRRLTTPEGMRQ